MQPLPSFRHSRTFPDVPGTSYPFPGARDNPFRSQSIGAERETGLNKHVLWLDLREAVLLRDIVVNLLAQHRLIPQLLLFHQFSLLKYP